MSLKLPYWYQAGVDLEQVMEQQDKRKGMSDRGLIQPKGRQPVSQVRSNTLLQRMCVWLPG